MQLCFHVPRNIFLIKETHQNEVRNYLFFKFIDMVVYDQYHYTEKSKLYPRGLRH